jgi:GTPase involved in cell partitioning and DNA repair
MAYQQFTTLRAELEQFHPQLLEKPYLVVLNKADLAESDESGDIVIDPRFKELGCPVLTTSTVTGQGLGTLKKEAFRQVLAKGSRQTKAW